MPPSPAGATMQGRRQMTRHQFVEDRPCPKKLAQPWRSPSLNTPEKESEMTYDNEAIVRHAYHTAEGNVLDIAGFVGSFAEDGVINVGHSGRRDHHQGGGHAGEVVEDVDNVGGEKSYRGEQVGELVLSMAKLFPDVHRDLHRVTVLGDTVAVELSIQGTFLGPLETPAGIVRPTGAKIDVPTADFWYLRDGKIETFDCYPMFSTMFAQMGVMPDFASAVAEPVAER
jgi:ketosteroid isomerase-like protein